MSCPRTRETDFAAFVLERRAPEFAALRDHYPRCRDCGREVARWSQLAGWLREEGVAVGEHPSAERLLAYQSAPASLAPAERVALEAHLGSCAPCRSELRVLAGFDFAALAPSGSPERAPGGWLAALGTRLFGRPLAPAFALAALLAIAVPAALLGRWAMTRATPEGETPPLARIETREAEVPPVARIETPPLQPPRADTPEPPAHPRVLVVPEPELAPAEVARVEAPARAEKPAAPERSAPVPGAAPSEPVAPVPREPAAPLRIAALLPSELPRYRPDAALAGGSLDPVRVVSVVRAGPKPLPALYALAPEHVGATAEPAPLLYWHLSAESAVPVEIAVFSEDNEAVPVVDLWLEPPVAAGLHAFRFADHGLRLAPGANYYWFAALVPNREQRDVDAVAGAALRFTPIGEALRARLDAAAPAERAHRLAEAGYWLDAFATFTAWLEAEPDAPRLRAQRAALLEQVGLAEVAKELQVRQP